MYFRNKGVQSAWLDKCLKSSASEQPLTVNMLKGPKHKLPNVSVNDIWNLRTVC